MLGTGTELLAIRYELSDLLVKEIRGESVRQFPVIAEQVADTWKKNPLIKYVGVAIAEDLLELLDRPQSPPASRGESRESNRPFFEALREGKHVDKELKDAWEAPVVFWGYDMESVCG